MNRKDQVQYYLSLDPMKKDKRQNKEVKRARKRSAQAAKFIQRRKKNHEG